MFQRQGWVRQGMRSTNYDVWKKSKESGAGLCGRCRPSLRDNNRPHQFDLNCALVLEVLSTVKRDKVDEEEEEPREWNGRIHMSQDEKADLLKIIEASAGAAMHRDNKLSLDEIKQCIKRKENRAFILEDLPESIAALANETYVEACFKHRDQDGSGKLDETEWINFLEDLEYLYHAYLLNGAFQEFRAFVGLGQDYFRNAEGTSSSSSQLDQRVLMVVTRGGSISLPLLNPDSDGDEAGLPEKGRFQLGLDPKWRSCWKDFVFYSANNHPIHGIFSCSPDHPLSWKERLVIEAVTVIFTYVAIWIPDANQHDHFTSEWGQKFLATVPGVVLWWVLFLLFVCPKLGIINEASSTEELRTRAKKWRCVGEIVGYMIAMCVLIGAGALAKHGRDYIRPGADTSTVLQGRVRGYFVFWFLQAFVYFNPLVAWGLPDTTTSAFGYVGSLIGLGQWRIERQRFEWICAKALKGWKGREYREQLLKDQNLWMKPRDAVWECEIKGEYKPYDEDCIEFIEHKYQKFTEGGPNRTKVFTGGFSFVIDFREMTQSGSKMTRRVRRRLRNSAA